jgi:2-polyprenyl-6-methoxyphenol hydroxylase-like FAD-dependent oxidoreductase
MKTENKNAIIIGCGIAGPAMALALQKIGIRATIYEALPQPNDEKGVFLGISPNGLNILKEFIAIEELYNDYTPGSMQFFNAKNKSIGVLDTVNQKNDFGAEAIQVKRGLLNKATRNAAIEKKIEIVWAKKLRSIIQTQEEVTAHFEDGEVSTADFLIGCDGIHSATRKSIFPDAPDKSYTGLLSTGGFSRLENITGLTGSIRMIFGKKAFFAYAVSNKNEVWWFNNISSDTEPVRNVLNVMEKQKLQEKLSGLHKDDPAPIAEIIQAAYHAELYPIYDIPFLQKWHMGKVCLIGDAAHATAPHIGQGASLALEDTVVLAKCIRDLPTLEQAFETFQFLRQSRVNKIIQQARKVGDIKKVPNRFQRFFRDLMLPYFVKYETRKMNWGSILLRLIGMKKL